jgi:hypothetical protein
MTLTRLDLMNDDSRYDMYVTMILYEYLYLYHTPCVYQFDYIMHTLCYALRSPLAAFFCFAALAAAASALPVSSAPSNMPNISRAYLCLSSAALSLSFLAWAVLF